MCVYTQVFVRMNMRVCDSVYVHLSVGEYVSVGMCVCVSECVCGV